MKRYLVASLIGSGSEADPLRPNVAGTYAWVATAGTRCLVKVPAVDGAPATAATVADLMNGDADVLATTLTPAQRTTLKTFLTNQGIDVAQFDADGVDDRRKFLRFLLARWLGWGQADFPRAIRGYDAG